MAEEKRIVVENRMDVGGYMQKTVDRGIQPPHHPWSSAEFYWMQYLAPPRNPLDALGMALIWFCPTFLATAGMVVFWEPIRRYDLLRFVFIGVLCVLAAVAVFRYTVRSSAPKALPWLDFRLFLACCGIIIAFVLFLQ